MKLLSGRWKALFPSRRSFPASTIIVNLLLRSRFSAGIRESHPIMLVEIICGLVIYKLFRRFFVDDAGQFPAIDGDDYRLCFLVADRFEKVYNGKAYVGLRIPDADSGSRETIDAVLVTEREVIVISVKNYGGYVEVGKDGNWSCVGDGGSKMQVHEDPVAETMKKVGILKSYFERRGLSLPQDYFKARVVLPSPYCRVSPAIYSASEVIVHEKWSDLKPMERGGFSAWIKDAFHASDSDTSDGLHQKLRLVLSTAPMWDRLELKGEKVILGEFLEFKGNQEDLQSLKSLKRSKVGRIVVQKSSLFLQLGRSKVQLIYFPRDYRGEGPSISDMKEMTVKESTELIFQPIHSRKTIRCKLSKVMSLSLSA
ncbi:plasma protein [Wolffia australiana]